MIPGLLPSAFDRRSAIGLAVDSSDFHAVRANRIKAFRPLSIGSLGLRLSALATVYSAGNKHSAPRDSTYFGVRCMLSHLSLLMDMQAPLDSRRPGGIGRPTSDSPDQLLQNMRRCIRVGGARRPSLGLMGIPSPCRSVGGHWGLAHCGRSQEARRRRGRLRLRRERNGRQLSKDPSRRCQYVGPGMICNQKQEAHPRTNQVGRGHPGADTPLWASSAPTTRA
jgi:hypothetical protein